MNSLRVAIADDDEVVLEDLKETLEDLGHKVVLTAPDGSALLEGCLKEGPDLVIADQRMPHLTGLQVARELRLRRPSPFLILSACELSFTEAQGVYGQLIKPVENHALQAAILQATERFREAV